MRLPPPAWPPLPTMPIAAGIWYRSVLTKYSGTPLATAFTPNFATRFNGGSYLPPAQRYPILYLAETPHVAYFEVGKLVGLPFNPFKAPNPHLSVTLFSIAVNLTAVVDLTDPAALGIIDTTVQELTGDWRGYHLRSVHPVTAPTQKLGLALSSLAGVEGFITTSARVPDRKVLVVFPTKLMATSSVIISGSDGLGTNSLTPIH